MRRILASCTSIWTFLHNHAKCRAWLSQEHCTDCCKPGLVDTTGLSVWSMAQVSVYDTINAHGGYSRKVRRLGEFHPALAGLRTPDAQDIDDPLYGNEGGSGEEVSYSSRCFFFF